MQFKQAKIKGTDTIVSLIEYDDWSNRYLIDRDCGEGFWISEYMIEIAEKF
jgi:hypothetical protein